MRFLFLACVWFGMNLDARAQDPVWDVDFPDPTVIVGADGYYYAYGTQGVVDGPAGYLLRIENVQAGRSRDLRNWERLPDALPNKPLWASGTQKFWAPDVRYRDGIYFLYFAAKPNPAYGAGDGMCIGAASSRRPGGPFVDSGAPLRCGPGFEDIDPASFDDPATGKALLYWGSGFGPIRAQELAADRLHFKPGGQAQDVLAPYRGAERGRYDGMIEGAWIAKEGEDYFLFFSGNDCCGPFPHYATMVARAKSALGPFEALGEKQNLLIEADVRWLAPGHCSVVKDGRGESWMFYHAIDRENPRLPIFIPGDRAVRRVLLRRKLAYHDGWPSMAAPERKDSK